MRVKRSRGDIQDASCERTGDPRKSPDQADESVNPARYILKAAATGWQGDRVSKTSAQLES